MSAEQTTEFSGPRIVTIGGGTGNFTILSGLKNHVREGLTAIVGMADDGGSTGELRDQYGALPPGDIRQCLVALSESPQFVRALMNYRFGPSQSADETDVRNGLEGHTLGNLMLIAAGDITGNASNGIQAISKNVLGVIGNVIPATSDDRRLVITPIGGAPILGEHAAEMTNIPSLFGAHIGFDKNPTEIDPEAEAKIKDAELIVCAPGDFYTSIAPAIAVRGAREALKGKRIVQVMNVFNRGRHTVGFKVSDFASEFERVSGAKLTYALYNTLTPTEEVLRNYAAEGEYPVVVDEDIHTKHYRAIGRRLLSEVVPIVGPNDALAKTRSLARHDPEPTARAIMEIYYGNGSIV